LDEAAHVIREGLHPDLSLGAHRSNCAHQRAAHIVGLRTEDVFDAHPDAGLGVVAALGLIGHRFTALAFAVDMAPELLRMQFRLDFFGAVGGIPPNPCAGVATHQQVIHRL
jgi:hypothetical protein